MLKFNCTPIYINEKEKVMKKVLSVVLLLALALVLLCACAQESSISVAIPSDAVGMNRSLVLLRDLGYIGLDTTVEGNFTVENVTDNPHNIKFDAIDAESTIEKRSEYDYVAINSDDAYSADIDPKKEALAQESLFDDYASVLVVKKGNEGKDAALALKAALESESVADYIFDEYNSFILSAVKDKTDGYNKKVDYSGLADTQITLAVSEKIQKDIVESVGEILEKKGITLKTVDCADMASAAEKLENGEVDAAFFQSEMHLDALNGEGSERFVSVCSVYSGPICIFGGTQTSLTALKEN